MLNSTPMAKSPSSSSSSSVALLVDTNLDTRLMVVVSPDDTVADIKGKLKRAHADCFPDMGLVSVKALKIEHSACLYHLSDSFIINCAFEGSKGPWLLYADLVHTTISQSGQGVERRPDPEAMETLKPQQRNDEVVDKENKEEKGADQVKAHFVVCQENDPLPRAKKNKRKKEEGLQNTAIALSGNINLEKASESVGKKESKDNPKDPVIENIGEAVANSAAAVDSLNPDEKKPKRSRKKSEKIDFPSKESSKEKEATKENTEKVRKNGGGSDISSNSKSTTVLKEATGLKSTTKLDVVIALGVNKNSEKVSEVDAPLQMKRPRVKKVPSQRHYHAVDKSNVEKTALVPYGRRPEDEIEISIKRSPIKATSLGSDRETEDAQKAYKNSSGVESSEYRKVDVGNGALSNIAKNGVGQS